MPKASLEEGIHKTFKGAATMRHQGFFDGIHFTEGFRLAIGDEHGVIAEAVRTPRRPCQCPRHAAFKELDLALGPSHAKRAVEMSPPLLRRCSTHGLQFFLDE